MRGRRSREHWERVILDSALETFSREGFGVPISRLIRLSGAPVGAFYRSFPDKEALFARLCDELHCQYLDKVRKVVGKEGGPTDRLARMVVSMIVLGLREFPGITRLYFSHMRGKGVARAALQRIAERDREMLLSVILEGIEAGKIECEHPELAATVIVGVIRATVDAYADGRRCPLIDQAAVQSARMVVAGLRTVPRTGSVRRNARV